MIINIGDRVFAKTKIIRCAILGTVQQTNEERILVVFDNPIKGIDRCWVERRACHHASKPKAPRTQNKAIKAHTSRIIDGLEAT